MNNLDDLMESEYKDADGNRKRQIDNNNHNTSDPISDGTKKSDADHQEEKISRPTADLLIPQGQGNASILDTLTLD